MQRRKFFRKAITRILVESPRLKQYLLWIDHPFVAIFIREKWLKSRILFPDKFIRFVSITCLGVARISKNSFRNSAGKNIEVG